MTPEPGPDTRESFTRRLRSLAGSDLDDPEKTARLLETVYSELRRLAAAHMRRERADHTLPPTALVHEAYLRLVDSGGVDWRDRAHFLGIASRVMRQVLVDHARNRGRLKRGGDWHRVTLDERIVSGDESAFDILALDEAMEKLASVDPRAARVVELRILGGLTVRETAAVLDISPRTVDADWATGRMFLGRALAGDDPA
jgi:RNA polymerase sigma factor (TIGR02999 family)